MQNRDLSPLPCAVADVSLDEYLDDYDETVRRAVALAFGPAGSEARELAPTIIRLIKEAQRVARLLVAAGATPPRLPQA